MSTYGWTLEQALEIKTPPDGSTGPKKIVIYDDKERLGFSSQSDAARHFSVPYKVFSSRINSGWSIEEALGIRVRPRKKQPGRQIDVEFNGKRYSYPSLEAAEKDLGIPRSRISAWLKRGWTMEQALELQPKPSINR